MSGISLSNGLDLFFLNLGSFCAEPLCRAYGALRYKLVMPLGSDKFDNATSNTVEIGKRILIGLGGAFAFTAGVGITVPAILILGGLSKLFRCIGFILQKENFTYIRTATPERPLQRDLPKISTFNLLGVGGGMHLDRGGANSPQDRLSGILQRIRNEDPDVLVLQEIYDTAFAKDLIKNLGGEFAHIFAHMGKTTWGSCGGLMVLTKCGVHHFDNEDFSNSTWQLKRGIATVEVKKRPEDQFPCACVIGTHLIHGSDIAAEAMRAQQVAQIVNRIARRTLSLPTFIAADSNIERDSAEGAILNQYFKHAYTGQDPTCTNRLKAQWYGEDQAPDEIIDIISLVKKVTLPDGRVLPVVEEGVVFEDCHLVRMYDPNTYSTRTALSDHNGLTAQPIFAF